VSAQGQITFSARYTPWGDTLQSSGTGNFTIGYLGGLMDTSTGLLYVGNGNYYDQTTGRFLNRNAKPDQTNPYVPWGGNPTGALFTPLALLSLVYSRKKKRGTLDMIIVLVVLSAAMSMSLTACTGGTPPPPTVAVNIATAPTPIPGLGIATLTSPEIPGAISTPVKVATTLCPTVTLTFTNTPTPTPSITPTAIDNVELTEKGKEAEALYQKYVNPPIEWWNKDGNFTIGKFLGLMFGVRYIF